MPIVKTEGILLKTMNFRDKSKILTFYTKEYGKMRFIAKGVRDTKTKWGGALQSMSYLNLIFYLKENNNLSLLTSAEHIKSFQNLQTDYDKMSIGFRMAELLNKTTEDRQQNEAIFHLMKVSLSGLNDATKNYVNLLFRFEYELARFLGFEIDTLTLGKNYFTGNGVEQYIVRDSNTGMSQGEVEILKSISNCSDNKLMSLNISKNSEYIIDRFFENHFNTHIENLNLGNTKRVLLSKEITV